VRAGKPICIDLSHAIEDGMTTYPGLPVPSVTEHLTRKAAEAIYSPGTTFSIGRIEMIANTGTYVDAPFHRFAEGPDVAALALERLAGAEGTLVDASRGARAIGAAAFEGPPLAGRAVLIRTGWDEHWRTSEYGSGRHPFLTAGAAEILAAADPALVGIDSVNIDDMGDKSRPAHTRLLAAGIPIVEHLTNLRAVAGRRFRFFAVPAPVRGMGSFPVRAFAIAQD
jgi:kynurenine formamidase